MLLALKQCSKILVIRYWDTSETLKSYLQNDRLGGLYGGADFGIAAISVAMLLESSLP